MPRKYTPEQKAEALVVLDAHEGNAKRTATTVDIPRSTVQYWKQHENSNEVMELKAQKSAALADSLLDLAGAIVRVIPSRLEDAPVEKLATALGITIDKWLLITGQSTSRNEHTINYPPLPTDRLDDILSDG